MRERLFKLLNNKNSFLREDETIIFIKNNEMISLWNDKEALNEISGNVNDKLKTFLEWLYDDDEY